MLPKSLHTVRSFLYALARLIGDINAIWRGPGAVAKRAARKSVWRNISRWIRW